MVNTSPTDSGKIDDCLSVRNNHLFIEEVDTTALVKEYGSPLFVMSENQIQRTFKRFKTAFSQHWPDGPVDVMPANKSNWTMGVCSILAQLGAGVDIYSEGELYAALECGIQPDIISVNGNGKSDAMLKKCIEAGVRITVEDVDEPARINAIAQSLSTTAKIRLRLKPSFPKLWRKTGFPIESVPIDTGIQVYKCGIPIEYIEALGQEVLRMPHVELMGFHYHFGRHSSSLWYWRRQMEGYASLIVHLCKKWNYQPKELDIGGGFATHRDPFGKTGIRGDAIETFLTYPLELLLNAISYTGRNKLVSFMVDKLLAKVPGKERAPAIEQYAEVVVPTFRNALLAGGLNLQGVRLQVEPGRSFYSDAGIHLASVKKMKRQTTPIKMSWVLTDTTYFFMTGGVLENNLYEFRIANKVDAPAKNVADIVGHSCFADRIVPLVKVPDLEPGDVIAFLDTGAYQEVSASNFNALPRPPVLLVKDAQVDVIKLGEGIEDVFRRDRVPERLKKGIRAITLGKLQKK